MSTSFLRLIAIVGLPGAGKTVVADFFRSHGYTVLRFGDQTDIGLAELGLDRNEKNERFYREKIRQELGMAAMAIKIEPRILDAANKMQHIILDGMRSWEEYLYLKERFPSLRVLHIFASPQTRYERLARRPERPLTSKEAKNRDAAEIEALHAGGPIAMADYLVNNEGDKETLTRELELLHKHLS